MSASFLPLSQSALIVVGHGSTVNPDSSAPTRQHVTALREQRIFGEVFAAFRKEKPSLGEALLQTKSRTVYIVPNFISEGYFTQKVIPSELGLTGEVSEIEGRAVVYCEPVGNHPKMTELLLRRACELAPEVETRMTSLLIVGHGTGLSKSSALAAKEQARKLYEQGHYGEVLSAYMEEAPFIKDWATMTQFPNVIVVPFFISDGLHSYEDIPVLLGIAEQGKTWALSRSRAVFENNPYEIQGKKLYYANAIGTASEFVEIILDQVQQACEKGSAI
ncbi:MAG: CbiX/SirB N-terminal domain-containing protein [Chthoniobacterales bacterium]